MLLGLQAPLVPYGAACTAASACHVQASLVCVVIIPGCRRPAAPLAHRLRHYHVYVKQTPLRHNVADTRRVISAGPPVHHFDLYRIESGRGLGRLEMDASLKQAVCLIEWSDRLPQAPIERLDLFFTLVNTAYQVSAWRDWSGTYNTWHAAQKKQDPFLMEPVRSASAMAVSACLRPAHNTKALSAASREDPLVLHPYHLSLCSQCLTLLTYLRDIQLTCEHRGYLLVHACCHDCSCQEDAVSAAPAKFCKR